MRPVNRITPRLPAAAMKTYQVSRPLPTHWRTATCAEVDCAAHQRGWTTKVDTATELGAKQAHYIRLHSGRAFTHTQAAGTVVTFSFAPGQKCFREHRVPLEREPMFSVVGGDWRGNPRRISPIWFKSHRAWLDDFGEHQARLAEAQRRG